MIFIYTTFPNKKSCKEGCRCFVKRKTNWMCKFLQHRKYLLVEGKKIERTKEVSVILKVARVKKQLVKKRLKGLHPCSVPCICEIKVNANKEFLNRLKNI